MKVNVLSGIKPSGRIHLGNYISAIKPVIDYCRNNDNKTILFFIADHHANTAQPDPKELNRNINDLMISYCALFRPLQNGSNNNNILFYRQSKVPQIFELYWILSCYTAKGLLNRNHTYKELTENNIKNNKDPDKSIFMGLFNYPILMASDILMFDPEYVPVGKDQLQHLEITNDIAQKINYVFNKQVFNYIKPWIDDKEFILLGNDGNKMSKSNKNTLPLFSESGEIKKYIYSMKTNNKQDGDPKYPKESNISEYYKAFSNDYDYQRFVKNLNDGISWKNAKDIVVNKINKHLSSFDYYYDYYKNKPDIYYEGFEINESILRKEANKKLNEIKQLLGMEIGYNE